MFAFLPLTDPFSTNDDYFKLEFVLALFFLDKKSNLSRIKLTGRLKLNFKKTNKIFVGGYFSKSNNWCQIWQQTLVGIVPDFIRKWVSGLFRRNCPQPEQKILELWTTVHWVKKPFFSIVGIHLRSILTWACFQLVRALIRL